MNWVTKAVISSTLIADSTTKPHAQFESVAVPKCVHDADTKSQIGADHHSKLELLTPSSNGLNPLLLAGHQGIISINAVFRGEADGAHTDSL
jgi:hypothetical protein